MKRLIGLGLLLALVAATGAWAQEYRGNMFVTIKDEQGSPVSGAAATLTGKAYSRTETTAADGKVRFIRLEPGAYDLVVKAQGFATMTQKSIEVATFANLNFDVKLGKIQFTEEMVITAQTPVLDQRKTGTSSVMKQEEVSEIPTARDPWAVLSTIPGVTTDRVNVGGNESGQQAVFVGKGDAGANTTWVMDGVDFTDLGAAGSSPTYFDFNTFEEIGAMTAGGDIEQTSPGVRLQFTTKQGSNRLGGKMSMFFTNKYWQNKPAQPAQPSWLTTGAGLPFAGNSIDQIFERNFEISGPIKADMAWFWFGFGQNNVDINKAASPTDPHTTLDKTQLRNTTVKFNGVGWKNFYWKVFYTDGNKTKSGRAGAAEPQAPLTLWNQDGPTPIWTADLSYFITPNFELSGSYSDIDGKFSLTPAGTASQALLDSTGTWQNTYETYYTKRPTKVATLRGNVFAKTGKVDHEIKFGYRYRDGDVKSSIMFGTQNVITTNDPGDPTAVPPVPPNPTIQLWRSGPYGVNMKYNNLWVGDTMLIGNFTVNVGVNYQSQKGNQLALDLPANGLCPTCLPAFSAPAQNDVIKWDNWLPRVGATYTFNTKKRGLVRAGYAEYADGLTAATVTYNLPAYYSYITYQWLNGTLGSRDTTPATAGDLGAIEGSFNVDPANPNAIISFNKTDPNLKAPRVREAILGTEWEVMRDFSLGATYTYRKRDRDTWTPNIDLNSTNPYAFVPASAWTANPVTASYPDGSGSYTVTPYLLTDPAQNDGSRVQLNRDGYTQEYNGLELTATKRLSNKWMLRAYVNYATWKQHFDGTAGISDPTNLVGGTTQQDGDISVQSQGSGKSNVWIGGDKYQFNINGLYQLPWDFTISGNLYSRQGYGITYYNHFNSSLLGDPTSASGFKDTQIGLIGDKRYSSLTTFDLRVAKLLKLSGNTTVELSADCFNCINADTVLQLDRRATASQYQRIREVLSPRVFRAGASIQF